MAQNMENVDFHTFFTVNFTTMVSTDVELWFLSSLEHLWPDSLDTLSKVASFFEKMHKVFKNKTQGAVPTYNSKIQIQGNSTLWQASANSGACATCGARRCSKWRTSKLKKKYLKKNLKNKNKN